MNGVMIIRDRDFSLRAAEVIREFVEGPHLLLRISVVGPHFPFLDSTPFVRIVGWRQRVDSLMAEVSPDQQEMRGYFPADTPIGGRIEWGYASEVWGSVPVRKIPRTRLDPKRIAPEVHRVTRRNLGAFRKQSR
jgi:hypothetical protein